MHTIKLFKKKYLLPSNWHEVPFKVCVNLTPLISAGRLDLSFLYVFLSQFIPQKQLDSLPDEYLSPLLELLSWSTNEPFLPKIPNKRKRFSRLQFHEELTIFELAYCQFHTRFLNDNRNALHALNQIYFTLYKKPGAKFDEKDLGKAIDTYGLKIPLFEKQCISMWLLNMHEQKFRERYLPKGESSEAKQEENKPLEDYGYFPLIYNLAREGIYGNYEETCLIPAHTVFFNLMISKQLINQ